MVGKVRLALAERRVQRARELVLFIEIQDPSRREKITPSAIAEVADLLRDDLEKDGGDAVRSAAARALGLIGPPAIGAVPALERALDELKDKWIIVGSVKVAAKFTSGSAVRYALREITGEPYHPW